MLVSTLVEMGCASSKDDGKKGVSSPKPLIDTKDNKTQGSNSQKSITFDKTSERPASPKPQDSKSSIQQQQAAHERQKSVTAGLRIERTGSQSSGENSGGHDRKSRLKKKGSDTQDGSKIRNSNLQENLVAVNSSTTNVREYYDGIDDEDNVIGSGNWGVVKVVTRKRDGKKFACKIVKLGDHMTDSQFDELRTEIDALRQLDHVAIAKLFETYEEPGLRLYLVMELLTGGELYSALVERSPTGRFDELRTRKLARRMVSAIAYLHDKGLVHRDIKLENFCFRGDESEDEIVLIDFGLAKLYELKQNMTEVVGSSYYVAPEIIEGSYSGPSPDMWSLGVILFMMLSGRPPFDGSSDQNIMRRAVKGRYTMDDEVWRTEVSTLAQDFVRRCLTRDPAVRMSSKEGLRHAWLTASEEALIDAGAGDDPARAIAPAVIPSVVSEGINLAKRASRRISTTIFGPGANEEMLERLRFYASRHELVRLFSQAVAFSVGRDEVRDLMKLFVKLDRDGDGTITAADIEVGLLGAPPEEVEEENRQASRGSLTIMASPRRPTTNTLATSKFPGFHSVDDATRHRRKRRREANYLFAAMDVQKKNKVSLNEFIAATLSVSFYKDEKLLGEAFARLCGVNAGTPSDQMMLTVRGLEGMLGSRFSDRRARRLIGEFVALARFGPKEPASQPSDPAAPSPQPISPPAPIGPPGLVSTASERFRKFGSMSGLGRNEEEGDPDHPGISPRRVDVDAIKFDDFAKGMMHAI